MTAGSAPRVGIVMGSDSDWPVMKAASEALAEFDVPFEADVVSAHRMPEEMLSYGRDADDRQRRHRGEHPRQVGRSPGAGDDHRETARRSRAAVLEHLLRHPVRGDDVGLEGDVELGERLRRRLHHRPVGVRPHHDADASRAAAPSRAVRAHSLSSPRSPANHAAA